MANTGTTPSITLGISYLLLMLMAFVHLTFGFVLAWHQYANPTFCYSTMFENNYKEKDRTWGNRQWCQNQDSYITGNPDVLTDDSQFAYFKFTSWIFICKGKRIS